MKNDVLQKCMRETAANISYSTTEQDNLNSTTNHLRQIIENHVSFNQTIIAGSLKRKTLVRGISDVDIYARYTEDSNANTALNRLRELLQKEYLENQVKQDSPSMNLTLNKAHYNITPYRENANGSMIVPQTDLKTWQESDMRKLEKEVNAVKGTHGDYANLIKLLKLWNFNYRKGLKNYEIESRVTRQQTHINGQDLPDMMLHSCTTTSISQLYTLTLPIQQQSNCA